MKEIHILSMNKSHSIAFRKIQRRINHLVGLNKLSLISFIKDVFEIPSDEVLLFCQIKPSGAILFRCWYLV